MRRPATPLTAAWAVALVLASTLVVAAGCASDDAFRAGDIAVRVEGTVASSPRDLVKAAARELAAFGAGRHRAAAAADAAYVVESELRDVGYAGAHVTFSILPDEEHPTTLVLQVEEGPRTVLGEVHFPGATVFAARRLRALVVTPRTIPFLAGKQPYRRSDVDSAMSDIEGLYLLRGHLRVKVGPPVIRLTEDGATADVEIPIVEGPRFTVERIQLDRRLSAELRADLRERLQARAERRLMRGAGFHVRLAAEVAAVVRGRLRELGHRTAYVDAVADVDETAATAVIHVEIEPGPRHHLGALTVSGTERTDPDFARERVPLEPGALLRQSDLDATIDALYSTGAFRRVRISDPPADVDMEAEDVTTDVAVSLEEREARSFEAGVGWGSYELLRGWTAYRDRNFTGMGRTLDIDARASLKSIGTGIRAADPYILGGHQTLSTGLRFETREQPSFDSRALEFDVQIRQELDRAHHVTYGYRMRIDEASDRQSRVRGAEDRRSRAAGIFGNLVHDTRDDRLFPTAGVLASGGAFWSDPSLGADLGFLEWKASWARYVPLGDDTVLAIGADLVTRDLIGTATSLPIQERLFLGGEGDVRSFREDELGPTDAGGDPLGGLTALTASVEVRRRLWKSLDGALFYDWGTVGEDAFDVTSAAGAAIGIGLRYRLPVGPVRLDFGYNPLDRFDTAHRWALHLSFGFSF